MQVPGSYSHQLMRFGRREKDSEILGEAMTRAVLVQADCLAGLAGNSMSLPRVMETISGFGLG
jgi:hypothetical protein